MDREAWELAAVEVLDPKSPLAAEEDTTPTLEDLWDPSEEDEVGFPKASLKASVSPTRSPTSVDQT